MGTWLEELGVYRRLIGAAVRGQMQYRTSFWIGAFTDTFTLLSEFLPIYFLVLKFGKLQGWSILELALLYGMVRTSWNLVETFCNGFEAFAQILVRGELDRLLLRPRSLLTQIAANNFQLRRLGGVLQSLFVLLIGIVGLQLGALSVAWITLGVLGGTTFFVGILMLGAASQFITLGQTSELQNMLTYGGSTTLTYPVSIYQNWFRRVVTYLIPLAFVNYFPALAALGRVEEAGFPTWLPALSPLVCATVMLLGQLAFTAGLRRYESTGS
ncbi:MAG: ABC-2 family transporter protein [Myxococcales bacterium]|nr:ABC-2 family transporter protein [Myxococcales bacterium]